MVDVRFENANPGERLAPNDLEAVRDRREFYTELGKEILINSSEIFVDFDVEGDGPAGFGNLCSIGAVAPTGEEFYVVIKPQGEACLPEPRKFCDSLGLTREYLEEHGVIIEEAGRMFMQWADSLKRQYNKPAVAAAFNAGYDWAHIDLAFAKAAAMFPEDFPANSNSAQPQHNPFGIAPMDTKSLALALPRDDVDGVSWSWRATSKNKLPLTVNPETEFTHNALDDAKYQQKQHFAMVGLLCAGKDQELDARIRHRIAERKRTAAGQRALQLGEV